MERSSQHETLKKAFLKLEELQRKLAAAEASRREPIAIVGIACRFPGGVRNLEDYWQLLREGRNAIADVPGSRWNVEEYFDPNPEAAGKMYTRKGAFIDGVDQFDPQFFGITPREVLHMDPQQRILLEVTWEALERAGIAPDSLMGSKTGVFTGVGFNDYSRMLGELDLSEMNAYTGPGTQICFATGRVSYTLGLRGPSVPIDTACSSSLVAIHQACQSLRLGESDLALAGGVNLVLVPEGNVWLSRAGALAPDGQCKTFDASADGFVRGEGCAVLVLKRLSDAVRDRDTILALIRGSAVNHDGRSSGLTVPSGPAQEALLRQALDSAGIEPEQVSYLEAHGTGTSLGDPIELKAALSVLGERAGRTKPLWVGSAKTNLGHLEACSGAAGVVKVVLMLQNRQIPPHLHFKQLNPMVALNGIDLRVPTTLQAWQADGSAPLIAGVSSFGLSGTNAHVLLEQAPDSAAELDGRGERLASREDAAFLLPISAAKPEALKSLARSYRDLLTGEAASFSDVCYTAAVGRTHLDHRLAITAKNATEAAELLTSHLEGKPSSQIRVGRRPLSGTAKLAFVFPAEDAYPLEPLGRVIAELCEQEPAFRESFEACDALFRSAGHRSPREALSATQPLSREDSIVLLFSFQVAQAALWRSWGVQPDGVAGFGIGEVAAAHVAEALSLEDAVALVRSRTSAGAPVSVSPRTGALPVSSGVTGRLCTGAELDPVYWQRSAKQPADVVAALRSLLQADIKLLLEIAPTEGAASKLAQAVEALGGQAALIRSGNTLPARRALLDTLAQLYVLGFVPNFRRVYPRGHIVPTLPSYPWQHQRYWLDLESKAEPRRAGDKAHPLLGHPMPSSAARPECVFWEADLGPGARVLPGLQRVGSRRVASTATFAQLALEAGREALSTELPAVTNLQLHRPLIVSEGERAVVQISVSPDEHGLRTFQVHSRPDDAARQERPWVLHASARLSPG